ncbi:MAG: tetratricopeptide repeat protein [Desulfobacterales bacterium]|nr:tetratricopeptide repeat protein [Desulfobacterales bacterium]
MAFSSTNGFRIDFSINFLERVVKPAVGLFLLTALLLVIYWPGFQGKWFLDDFDNIHKNPNIHAEALTLDSLAPAIYGRDPGQKKIDRPVAYLTLAANWALGRTDPLGYHIVNFLIHVLTAITLYGLARITLNLPAMTGRYGANAHAIALLCTLLWAVHPIQVTAVTYIVQRMAALATLFTLLAMIGYVKWQTGKNRSATLPWLALCGCCALMAIGSKENAAMLPVSLYLYSRFFLPDPGKQNRHRHLVLVGLAVGVIAGIAAYENVFNVLTSGYAFRPFTLIERLWTQPRAIFFYLWLIVYPVSSQFTLLHDITLSTGPLAPWSTLPSILALGLLTGLAVVYRRKAPLLGFAWLFFLANHLVEGSVLPLELVFEHRNYLPSAFLFLASGAGFLKAVGRFSQSRVVQPLAIVCGIIILAAAGHTTHMRNALFADEITFWQDNVIKAPALHRPLHNLGSAYFSANQWERGIAVTELALEGKVLARTNQKQVSHFNLAKFYLYAGMEDAARSHYEKVLELVPNHPQSLNGLARIMLNQGDIQSALRYNGRALGITRRNSDFLATRGLILLRQDQPKAAFQAGLWAWRANHDNPLALFLLGEACRVRGKLQKAAYFFNQALDASPSTHAPVLALIEIADLQHNPARVRELVARLIQQAPKKPIGRLLAAYQRQYNFMHIGRTERIARAIRNTCTRLSEID